MARYDDSKAEEEILLSSDQTERAIMEYIHDRNFLVGGASSVRLNWTLVDGKAPLVRVIIKRDKSPG